MQCLTDSFVAIGNGLIENKSFQFDHLKSRGGQAITIASSLVQAWTDEIVRQFSNVPSGQVLGPYRQALSSIGLCDVNRHIALMTCKRFFEYVDSITAHADFTVDGSGEKHTSSSVNLLDVIGSSEEDTSGEKDAIGIKAELKAFFAPLADLLDVCIKFNCPNEAPGIPDAIEAYLKGQIDAPHLQCLIEINGGRYDEWYNVVTARREQLNADEIIRLWMRKHIDDSTLATRLRDIGMLLPAEIEDKKTLSQEVPPITDIIRFMTLNIYNDAIVGKYKLDDEFNRAGTQPGGQLDDWRLAQGIPDEAFKAYWRAHWARPSPTQMAEMVQRLRPGAVDPSIETTAEDFDNVLRENDWLAFWRPRMLALAYRPLTRIDSRRAFNIGILSDSDFLSAMQNIGYALPEAETLLIFAKQDRINHLQSNKLVNAYEKGGISRADVLQQLTAKGFSADDVSEVLDTADSDMRMQARIHCISDLEKQFASGALDAEEFRNKLLGMGVDAFLADTLVSRNCREVKQKEKHETAGTLCDWYTQGLITPDNFSSRLTNIGYSPEDVVNIISRCNIKIAVATEKRQEQMAKQAAKDALATARRNERIRKTAESNQKAVTTLADKLSNLNGIPANAAADILVTALRAAESAYHISPERMYEIVRAMSASLPKKGPINIAERVNESARAFGTAGAVGPVPPPPH